MGYGIPERAAMIALMALNKETPNAELKRRYGLDVRKPARNKLNRAGLVQSRRLNRGYAHELTDAGWAWVVAELDGQAPPRAGSAGGALYALLNGLKVALDARGMPSTEPVDPGRDSGVGARRAFPRNARRRADRCRDLTADGLDSELLQESSGCGLLLPLGSRAPPLLRG